MLCIILKYAKTSTIKTFKLQNQYKYWMLAHSTPQPHISNHEQGIQTNHEQPVALKQLYSRICHIYHLQDQAMIRPDDKSINPHQNISL